MTYPIWVALIATYMLGGYGIYDALFEMAGAGGRGPGRMSRTVCGSATAGILIASGLFVSWHCMTV